MRALNRKLLRDVWQHRGQVLSIAAVVATGTMTVLIMRGTYESLVAARDDYYQETHFPDVWANVERAPLSLARRIQQIPGVGAVETRITFTATLDAPASEAPGLGQFVSLPTPRRKMLADIHIREGRYLAQGREDEALISEKFAVANGLEPGDTLRAILNGRFRALEIVGTAISPEHSYAVPPGAIFPENERYGVVWMSEEALGAAFDMRGAWNDLVLSLSPGADPDRVIAEVDRLLDPYGGLGAYARDEQISNQMLQGELDQNQSTGTIIPIVFLSIAGFLLNLVLSRLIATQRTEIAVLKAFGYNDREVAFHYLQFAFAAVLIGTIVGVIAGVWLGGGMVGIYTEYFDFPALTYRFRWPLAVIAVSVSTLAAALGALSAVRRAFRLPPAEAMRPEPPASFKPGILERAGIGQVLPAAGRMILRNLERQPFRAFASALGVAFSVSVLVMGLFSFDSIRYMMDLQFGVAQQEDLSLTFNRPLSMAARYDLSHLEGVLRVEPYRVVPVRLHNGHREEELAIMGMETDTRLRRIVTFGGDIYPVPSHGIVLSRLIADRLRIETGDSIAVEVLEGARPTVAVPVAGVVEDFLGVAAYMELEELLRLTRSPESISGAFLQVTDESRADLNAQLKTLPSIAGVADPAEVLRAFEEQLAQSIFISFFFILGLSAVISVAVIYNGARIALSERGRELASLRVLGFSRREVAILLLGEQGIVTLAAIPLGWLLGYGLAYAMAAGLQTEAYRIPFVMGPSTFFWSAVVTFVAAGGSAWIVRRRLDRFNLVEVLKTRE